MRAVMKMASLPAVTVFLLCCSIVTSTGSPVICDLYAKTSGSIIIPLDPKLKPNERVEWTFNKTKLFYGKVDKAFHGKTEDIDKDGSLKLNNLDKSRTGRYQHVIFNEQRQFQSSSAKYLCVQDPVKKPKLVMKCNGEKVQFTCIAEGGVSFKWFQNKKLLDSEKISSLTKVAKDVKSAKFYCEVSNQVSSETSNEMENTCVKTTIPGLPDDVMGISIWIFIGGGGGIVLILIVVVIVCCIKARRKKRMRLKDEEELRLEWSNPQQQQRFQHSLPPPPDQHPPRHPQRRQQQQQQPGDHVCHAGNAGHTGPRQNRSKQQRPRAPEPPASQPQPSPRRAAQVPKPDENADEEQPPPLPQPRKKHS